MRDYGTAIDRYWQKVVVNPEPGGCWGWSAGLTSTGYPKVSGRRGGPSRYLAHRLSWEVHNGRDVPDGLFVCHRCDNPICTNPAHLWIGTCADNNADAIAKGRTVHHPGVKRYNARLTDDLVREARRQFRAGDATIKSLAAAYGVSFSTLQAAVGGKTWKHVQG